jgi:hypothetical protein
LAINTNKCISVPDSLEKQRDQALRVVRSTIAGHNLGRVSDVRLVIKRISGSVPAAREHQFESNAVSAVSVKVSLVEQEVAKKRAFRGCGVIKTVKSEGSLSKKRLSVVGGHVPVGLWDVRDRVGEVTLIDISRYHCKIFREGFNNGLASVWVKEIVSSACQ